MFPPSANPRHVWFLRVLVDDVTKSDYYYFGVFLYIFVRFHEISNEISSDRVATNKEIDCLALQVDRRDPAVCVKMLISLKGERFLEC